MEHQGSSKIVAVKLHTLRQEFEIAKMKPTETTQVYVNRILSLVYQIRQLGDTIIDQTVVGRVLRSLTPRFHHVVSSIIEAQDLTTLTVEQLGGSLRAHEARLNLYEDHSAEEKALEVRASAEDHAQVQFSRQGSHGRGRREFRGRFRGRGRGRHDEAGGSQGGRGFV